jgi:dTDP-4-amino-4,6-dideoxygalactose transaminase
LKIQRTIPPTATLISLSDLLRGLSGIFLREKEIKKFESEMKASLGVKHLYFVSSGKAALYLILTALRSISDRRQVVIPAYTCFSVPSAIKKAGLEVKLCDIDLSTLHFDDRQLEKTVTEETLCVVPNHLFGIPEEMDRINELCKKKGVYVVEDAAQAMGGNDRGRPLGTLGDVGFFSLGRGKNITCGSGGIIVTNSTSIAEALSPIYSDLPVSSTRETFSEYVQLLFMVFFIRPALYWFPSGLPFLKLGQTLYYENFPVKRLSSVKVGLLRNWRTRLDRSNRLRVEAAADFIQRLHLKSFGEDPLPYLRLPVLMQSREQKERLCIESRKKGLGVSPMYPSAINEVAEIGSDFREEVFPSAMRAAERLVTLPTHPLLSEQDKKKICELFESNLRSFVVDGKELSEHAFKANYRSIK